MKNRKKGIVLSYINTALSMVIGVFLSSFYIKQLGSTEFGIYESISSYINYLVLLEFGTGTAMTRNLSLCLSKKKTENDVQKNVSTIWVITIFLAFIILSVALVFFFLMDGIYSSTMAVYQIAYAKKIFVFLLFYLLFSFFLQTMNGIVLAYENYTYSSKVSIFKTVSKTILIVGLILIQKQAIYIAIVDMVISAVITIYTYFYCKKNYHISFTVKHFEKQVLKLTLPLCLALFLQVIVNQANSNVDKFLISIMISPEAVSLYSISLYIYSMFSSSTTIPISIYAPQIIREVGKGIKGKELAQKLIQPSRLIVIIGGLILFGFVAVGKQFITILYGADFIDAWLIAIIIMIPMFINMSNGVIVNVLDAINKRMVRSLALLFTTVCNIIMTVFFIKLWGPIGAAIATLICTFLGQILIMNFYYHKKLKLPILYMFKETYKGILIYQILSMIIAFFIATRIVNVYISFIVGGIVFVAIFAICFIFLGRNDYEKKMIEKVLNKLHFKKVNHAESD